MLKVNSIEIVEAFHADSDLEEVCIRVQQYTVWGIISKCLKLHMSYTMHTIAISTNHTHTQTAHSIEMEGHKVGFHVLRGVLKLQDSH